MQRSTSSNVSVTGAPSHCGRPATPLNRSGSFCTASAIALLFASQNQCTILSGFSECISEYGRGEMKAMSVPTSSNNWECVFPAVFQLATVSAVTPACPLP